MYYVGEISEKDFSINGGQLIELWDGVPYTHPIQAKRKIDQINKKSNDQWLHLQIIDDKKYDVFRSQGWE